MLSLFWKWTCYSLGMLSLEELRKLEPALKTMNDDEVYEVRAKLYALAYLAFDVWQKQQQEKSVSKNPQRDVTHEKK